MKITKRYEVKAKLWNDEINMIVYKVVGSFDDYVCASLFAEAYSKHYSAGADIITYQEVQITQK